VMKMIKRRRRKGREGKGRGGGGEKLSHGGLCKRENTGGFWRQFLVVYLFFIF
jgi:hypothetical protein